MKNRKTGLIFSVRTTIVVLSFFLFQSKGVSQIVTIPDANFVIWIEDHYPSCITGDQLDTQCPGVLNATTMIVISESIADLSGVEHFTSLWLLYCSSNLLTSLPDLPATLTHLNCNSNELVSLSSLPNGLLNLHCDNNDLATLPLLPATLELLSCASNNLTTLPTLPANLYYLNCSANNLASLPALPSALSNLDCSSNPLGTLPVSLPNLGSLYCTNNQLTSLPSLPGGLWELNCSNNSLTSLPILPAGLSMLDCSDNNLQDLPNLPSWLGMLNVDNNPNLACLPFLPVDTLVQVGGIFGDLVIVGTQITCLPNVPPYAANVNSLPICLPGDLINNPNGCNDPSGINSYTSAGLTDLQAYPNPSTGAFYIDLPKNKENYIIRISDMSGRVISTFLETGAQAKLDLSNEETGVYFLMITSGKDVFMCKLLKY